MRNQRIALSAALIAPTLAASLVLGGHPAGASSEGGHFISTLKHPSQIGSTIPANGDLNPYGVAVVSESTGRLVAGDTLVSNFNDKANVQGTGSTVVEISPSGGLTPFATITPSSLPEACPGGIGLTTALAVLPGGWVVVGSLPAGKGGSLPTANPAGCLVVLNSSGAPVETLTGANINGPWDLASHVSGSTAQLFVTNALSRPASDTTTPQAGLCTVVRIDLALSPSGPPTMTGTTVIGTGFPWQANSTAFVQAPTGVALSHKGTLYVAETVGSTITAIPDAITRTSAVEDDKGSIITSGGFLNGPLGMTLAPDGDLLAVNGNNGDLVEVSPQGHQIAKVTLVPKGAGDLFGLAVAQGGHGLLFVNDGTNALDMAGGATTTAAAR